MGLDRDKQEAPEEVVPKGFKELIQTGFEAALTKSGLAPREVQSLLALLHKDNPTKDDVVAALRASND